MFVSYIWALTPHTPPNDCTLCSEWTQWTQHPRSFKISFSFSWDGGYVPSAWAARKKWGKELASCYAPAPSRYCQNGKRNLFSFFYPYCCKSGPALKLCHCQPSPSHLKRHNSTLLGILKPIYMLYHDSLSLFFTLFNFFFLVFVYLMFLFCCKVTLRVFNKATTND